MLQVAGFRSHIVIENKAEAELDKHGAFVFIEVTAATDTKFYPNHKTPDGRDLPANGIPLKAGVTRQIPMSVWTFKADAPVTVVAYGR